MSVATRRLPRAHDLLRRRAHRRRAGRARARAARAAERERSHLAYMDSAVRRRSTRCARISTRSSKLRRACAAASSAGTTRSGARSRPISSLASRIASGRSTPSGCRTESSSTPSRGDSPNITPDEYMDAHVANLERFAREMPVDILAHPTLLPPVTSPIAARGALDRGARGARRPRSCRGRNRVRDLESLPAARTVRSARAVDRGVRISLGSDGHTDAQVADIALPLAAGSRASACPTTSSTIRSATARAPGSSTHARTPELITHVIRYHARYVLPITLRRLRDGVVAVERAASRTSARGTDAPPAKSSISATRCSCPGSSTRTAISSSPRCAAFSRISISAAGFFASRMRKRAVLSREMLLDSARYGIEEGLRPGITTYADTCDSGVVVRRDARVRRSRHHVPGGVRTRSRAVRGLDRRAARQGRRIRVHCETPLVRVGVSPHAPYTVSDALFRRGRAICARRVAADGDSHRRERARAAISWQRGADRSPTDFAHAASPSLPRARSPIELLHALDVLGCAAAADSLRSRRRRRHRASSSQRVARSLTVPASNAKLGHGIAPLSSCSPPAFRSASAPIRWRATIVWICSRRRGSRCSLQRARARGLSLSSTAETVLDARDSRRRPGAWPRRTKSGRSRSESPPTLRPFRSTALARSTIPIAAAVFALPGTPASFVAVAGEILVRDGVASRLGPVAREPGAGERQRTADGGCRSS